MAKKSMPKKLAAKSLAKLERKPGAKKASAKKSVAPKPAKRAGGKHAAAHDIRPPPPLAIGSSSAVLDRLYDVIVARRDADPEVSHSARLLARGTMKIAQKFGEEAVECLIEAVSGNRQALIGESADVLYHLMVIWVNAGVPSQDVWAELHRREGVSGIAEKASRVLKVASGFGTRTTKIP